MTPTKPSETAQGTAWLSNFLPEDVDNARVLLECIVRENLLTARAVYGFWPAAAEDDDIVVCGESGAGELLRFNMLRQQEAATDGRPNLFTISATVQAGAVVHCGGEPLPGPGWFYAPTVLSAETAAPFNISSMRAIDRSMSRFWI